MKTKTFKCADIYNAYDSLEVEAYDDGMALFFFDEEASVMLNARQVEKLVRLLMRARRPYYE